MSFVYKGVSSDTMKFNVTSRQVYNAPAYDLNAIEVPGRSGDLLNPQNRFKNKQVSYTGFLKASDFEGSTWREKLSTGLIQLKGWLCSDAGQYHELTDDYDPGFTRYGYISGETAISDIEDRPFGVTLTVTFNVKPYMYKAGEPMELPETKSASGSIITITDGAENTPLKSAVVNIEPQQDLHGYANPWPAGGGVNILPPYGSASATNHSITLTNDDGKYTLNGTADATYAFDIDINIVAGSYTLSVFNPASGSCSIYLMDAGSNVVVNQPLSSANIVKPFTTSVTLTKCRIRGNSGSVLSNYKLTPVIVAGSTAATAFSPYSNICPISGWTQVNVVAANHNLTNPAAFSGMTEVDGVYIGSSASMHNAVFATFSQGVGRLRISFDYKGETSLRAGYIRTEYHDGTIEYPRPLTSAEWVHYSFQTSATKEIKMVAFSNSNTMQIEIKNFQIVTDATEPAYESPHTTPITISLGQTVYGGTLDVVKGKLVIDRAAVDMGNLTYTYTGYIFTTPVSGAKYATNEAERISGLQSSIFRMATSAAIGQYTVNGTVVRGPSYIAFRDDRYTTAASFKTAMTGQTLVYELATPIEVDLTPQTIKTLLGTNNIWADAGSMEIEYPIPTENPYLFGSRPLYEITMDGTGTLVVNGKEWTITDYTGTLYCDTEAMEWYDASQLRNNIVSGDGWPVFEAGENSVSYTGDITKVMVTPRWRTL